MSETTQMQNYQTSNPQVDDNTVDVVFPFDDLFDNGALKDDPYTADKVINALLSDMDRGVGRNNCTNGRDRLSFHLQALLDVHKYALKLDLPDKVFENESIKEIQRIGVDFVVIHNDTLSYCKEEAEEVPHNLVAITRYQMQSLNRQSCHAQDAFDIVGNILSTLYKRWFLALAELPSWGERVDADVQKYIASVRAIVMANLNLRQVLYSI
ncbi:hypothetical protein ZTR_10221 [Talaromyces verruculosus]|nr:hypothetical protein ZTR_10221 [Talaromyces verruculosus]